MKQTTLKLKKYLGLIFGHGEKILNGNYAVPVNSSRGPAFLKLEVVDGEIKENITFSNFYWDENLQFSWIEYATKPQNITESPFASLFREITKY